MHTTYESLISLENIFIAWEEFRRGKQWKQDVLFFELHLEDNLFALWYDLRTRTYRHESYERFSIHDPKHRVIHKATVRDRVVHHLLFRYLERIYEPRFLHQSYSCQRGKGTHRAVDDLTVALRRTSRNYTRPVWALEMDIEKFFDSVDHVVLLRLLHQRIQNSDILWLLEVIIWSYRSWKGTGKGVPIGNLTSQIFANIYLHELDQFVKHRLSVRWYYRYADDFLILVRDPTTFLRLQSVIQNFLSAHLLLNVHQHKVVVRKLRQGIDFVGTILLPWHRVLRTKTRRRVFQRMNDRMDEYYCGTRDAVFLYQSLQSYLGMLQHVDGYACTIALRDILV